MDIVNIVQQNYAQKVMVYITTLQSLISKCPTASFLEVVLKHMQKIKQEEATKKSLISNLIMKAAMF